MEIDTGERLDTLLTWARASILMILKILESNNIIPRGTEESQKELLEKLLSGEVKIEE